MLYVESIGSKLYHVIARLQQHLEDIQDGIQALASILSQGWMKYGCTDAHHMQIQAGMMDAGMHNLLLCLVSEYCRIR